MINVTPANVIGLGDAERQMLSKLVEIHGNHESKNAEKVKYYEGKIPLSDVNLGIALPKSFAGLEIGCAWGSKAVDVLAARSMFDGYVGENGQEQEELTKILDDNKLLAEYNKTCRDELLTGASFATLSADPVMKCRIRFHSAQTAAAVWDGERGRIAYGLAIIDSAPDNDDRTWSPSLVNLYTDTAIWVLRRNGSVWTATEYPQKMGRPLMEALIWNPTSGKPFGRSRIKEPIRRLIQSYVRTIANATIGLEFSTAPQKYLMGVTDDQYDIIINQKFKQYIGNILASTTNPETGEKPTFGQLQQGTISPHVEMMRIISTQFAAATGLSVTDTGVVNDANPTSADALQAQTTYLISLAEQLNKGNGNALKTIGQMALAIANDTTIEGLTDDQRNIVAHFKNPAMPSVSATADAAIKIATSREGFSQTDVFLEMLGFDQADIRRIKAQEARARGLSVMDEIGGGS